MTLQERIEEVMAAKNWQVHHVATAAGVSSAAVSQWIGRGGKKQTKSIGNFEVALKLERATGYSARWLAKGIGPKLSPMSEGVGGETRMSQSVTSSKMVVPSPTETSEIPTTMNYAPDHLRNAILLMGSLLGALDGRSRKTIGGVLNDLANAPDEASYFASIAVTAAKEQIALTENEDLERALHPARKAQEKV